MSANGMAGIYFLKPGTTINGADYAELLQDKLQTHIEIHQSLIFMHDVHLVIDRKFSSSFLQKITLRPWIGLGIVPI